MKWKTCAALLGLTALIACKTELDTNETQLVNIKELKIEHGYLNTGEYYDYIEHASLSEDTIVVEDLAFGITIKDFSKAEPIITSGKVTLVVEELISEIEVYSDSAVYTGTGVFEPGQNLISLFYSIDRRDTIPFKEYTEGLQMRLYEPMVFHLHPVFTEPLNHTLNFKITFSNSNSFDLKEPYVVANLEE